MLGRLGSAQRLSVFSVNKSLTTAENHSREAPKKAVCPQMKRLDMQLTSLSLYYRVATGSSL